MNFVFRAIWAVLLLYGCAVPGGVQDESEPGSGLFAEIDGKQVRRAEFEAYVAFKAENSEGLSERELVESYITQEVLLQAAERSGIEVSSRELDPLIPGSLGEERDAASAEEIRQQLGNYLRIQKYLRAQLALEESVGLRELTDYYNEHAEEFQVAEQVRVLEILVKDLETADAILSDLQPGNFRRFREAAMRYSIGATAARGGDLGLFQPGELPYKFEEVIFDLKVGEIGSIFRSEHGFHIFMVEERIPRHAQKFYEVHQNIFNRLVAEKERQALDQFVTEALRNAKIFIYEDNVKKTWRYDNGL